MRSFLFNVRTQNLPQGVMKQVRGRMVAGYCLTPLPVNDGQELRLGILRGFGGNVQDQVVFLDGVGYTDPFSPGVFQITGIPCLPSALCVKRRLVQDDMIKFPVFGPDFSVAQNPCIGAVVSYPKYG